MNQRPAVALKPTIPTETIRLSDWSGLTDFGGTAEMFAPANEEEIVALVRQCRANRKKLRVVGLQTSWNAWWYTTEVMMSTNNLRAITDIDVANRTVTCQPGTTLAEVHKALWEKGLTLDTAPAVDWVTVAGAISTGSHGSGPPSISSSLISCRLVTADGEVLQVGEGDRRLDAIRISMGAFGVLSSVTLRVAPGFHVRLKRTRMPESDWKRFLTEGEMSYVQWFPQTGLACLSRVDVLDQAGATHVDADALEHAPSLTESGQLTRAGNAVLELGNNATSFFSARNRFLLDVFFQDSETSGPAHKLLMSYKSDPVAGAEWSVPVQKFEDAFAALQRLVTDERYFLPIVWLKKVKGETAWLSAADGECVQCGIYHSRIPGTRDHARDMVHRVERLMLKFAGRPHVGKLISLDPADLRAVYPNWNRFNTLRKQMDPDGMFWSNELAAAFGE